MSTPTLELNSALHSFELPEDESPDFEAALPTDTAPLRCQADGCINSVIKPARGRTPKFCPDHKPDTGSKQTAGRGAWPKAIEVEKLLNGYVSIVGAGAMYTVAFSADGEALLATGPAIVHEVIELARTDKKLRLALERLATPGRYGPLAMAIFPLVLSIVVNHNLLPASLLGSLLSPKR